MAYEWSQRIAVQKKFNSALVVFKLNDSVEWFSSSKGETFNEDSEEWKSAVRYFRNGKKRGDSNGDRFIRKPRADQLSRYDFLFGPVAMDGWLPNRRPLRANDSGEDVIFQLCIKAQDAADRFYNDGRNIEKVVFFRKS